MTLPERARKGDLIVLGIAALVLAAASPAEASSTLASTSPWWDRLVFTVSGDGDRQYCRYESSLSARAEQCDSDKAADSIGAEAAAGAKGTFTRITVERRFSPGNPGALDPQAGETLLGKQVMSLAIDRSGSVRSCRVVGTSGDVNFGYGCAQARAERFEASAGRSQARERIGYLTILVYGHEEHLA